VTRWLTVPTNMPNPAATTADVAADPRRSAFIAACRREPVSHTPVWFMRQAGRSLPEYRALREGTTMLEACTRPDLVTEITLQPVRRYGVDAAIFFSDIVLPLRATGVGLDIVPGIGPVVDDPVRRPDQVAAIRPLAPDDVPYVTEAIQTLVGELGATPLIGFAGAPFTLASYLVEGGPSRNHEHTKALMYSDEGTWHALMERLADVSAAYLRVQVDAGASAIQLFDSWVGALSARDYERYVLPHSRRILQSLSGAGVPRIHFGVNTGELLPLMRDAGADVVGVDYRLSLEDAAHRVGADVALQGNLDPAVVFASPEAVTARVDAVLDSAQGLSGHVFNLGHGVLPTSDPDVLAAIVRQVHARTSRNV
jgi:uroporphyrinogen decarboxylase